MNRPSEIPRPTTAALSALPDTCQAILSLLAENGIKAGDCINLVRAEYDLDRRGIAKHEFCRSVVQLLDQGLFEMSGNAFYLSSAGHEALTAMRSSFPLPPPPRSL